MTDKKSILEEALLDINNIQNALNANTKEILRSVAKEEINGVVKESLEEEIYEEEDVEETIDETLNAEEDADETAEITEQFEEDEHIETLGGSDIEGQDFGGDSMNPEMGGIEGDLESGVGMDDMGSSDEIDMTDASDDEVIAIYKKLSGEDEIEIVGDELHLNISEPGEYVIKLDGSTPSAAPEMGGEEDLDLEPAAMGGEVSDEMGSEEGEDVDYEIELDDEEGVETPEAPDNDMEAGSSEEESDTEEEELDENLGHVNGYAGHQGQRRNGASHLGFGKKSVDGEKLDETIKAKEIVSETAKRYNSLLTEATKLKGENEEFRKALKEFRTKLVETVIFNSNLTYVTKLFMEHSTTKGEKQNIIKRFDEGVGNLKESKKLYKTIANELESRKPIAESVENKIIKEATTSTSKQLNESTAYVDPSTKRIMDLINRVEKR